MNVYFRNLNSLRFIAASIVIISHVEQFKLLNNLPNIYSTQIIFLFGKLGVDIFFVLSGFLITSLLLIEENKFQTIDVGKFYIRRILRIWPLYYLIVITSLFILPHFHMLRISEWSKVFDYKIQSFILMCLFLPNLQIMKYGQIPYAAQSWSIGVEEQFYLMWPWLVRKFKTTKRLLTILLTLLALFIVFKIVLEIAGDSGRPSKIIAGLRNFVSERFQIDCMMIGGLFAIFQIMPGPKKIITLKSIQFLAYILIITFLSLGYKFGIFFWEIYGLLFGICILNLVNSETSIISLDFSWLDYLGKISYGMYMFHPLIINIVIRFVTNNPSLIYLCSFSGTILISSLSYEFFEKKFLKFKRNFAKIQSGSRE